MSSAERLRVVLMGLLALGVMAGVVVIARRGALRPADHGAPTSPTGGFRLPERDPTTGRRAPLPDECLVTDADPPVVAFDLPERVLDLGALRQGQVAERDVVVRNTGGAVLCVQDVETGCGCVAAEWVGEKWVPPGASGLVRVRLDASGREGLQEKSVTLWTNVPKDKTASFTVRGEVRLGLIVASSSGLSSSFLSFGQTTPGRPATVRVRLKCPKDEPPWEVTGLASINPSDPSRPPYTWELLRVEPEDPLHRCYDLVVTHPGRADVGSDDDVLVVTTTHPERPRLEFNARLYVVRKYFASPARGHFGFVRASDPPPRRTLLVVPGEQGAVFRVTGATVRGDGFLVDEPRAVREGWSIDVRYDGRARGAGKLSAVLVVTIDDPEMPTLEVPLSGDMIGS